MYACVGPFQDSSIERPLHLWWKDFLEASFSQLRPLQPTGNQLNRFIMIHWFSSTSVLPLLSSLSEFSLHLYILSCFLCGWRRCLHIDCFSRSSDLAESGASFASSTCPSSAVLELGTTRSIQRTPGTWDVQKHLFNVLGFVLLLCATLCATIVCFHVRRPLKSNKTGPISIRIYPAKWLKRPCNVWVVLAEGSCGEEMLREIGKGTCTANEKGVTAQGRMDSWSGFVWKSGTLSRGLSMFIVLFPIVQWPEVGVLDSTSQLRALAFFWSIFTMVALFTTSLISKFHRKCSWIHNGSRKIRKWIWEVWGSRLKSRHVTTVFSAIPNRRTLLSLVFEDSPSGQVPGIRKPRNLWMGLG